MFDINTKVVCINDRFPLDIRDYFNALPVKGGIYTVRDIVPAQTFKLAPTCGVLLAELVNRPNRHGIEPGFAPDRFRELDEHEARMIAVAESAMSEA